MQLIRRPFRYSFFNVTAILIGLNILIFAAQQLLSYRAVMLFLALNPVRVLQGAVWQFVTYMFVHGGISHLAFNMIALFFFGYQVERELGSKEFLLYYLVCGVFAGVLSFALYLATGAFSVFLIGASGAVFAVQLAFAVLRPEAIIYLWGLLPLRAPVLVLGATAVELVSSVFGFNAGVAHLTHLLGFAFGWLYFLIRFGVNPGNRLFCR
jgi:membrane associated rhomboid family serine protease